MPQACFFCFKEISSEELDDPDLTYREVRSWVTGHKSQSPVLREQTGNIAHLECVQKLVNGIAVDMEPIPGLEN